MLQESTNTTTNIEIEDLEEAADLLQRMFLELEDLEVNSARVHFAMSHYGHVIRQRLDMLAGIIALLKTAQELPRARGLVQRAQTLIRQLSGELEQLALEAEHDFDWIA
jgi:hypothetical protein